MPSVRDTMLDVAISNGHDKITGIIEESLREVPEFGLFPARQISGTSYTTLSRKTLPTASFTQAGGGIAGSKSTWERKLVQCFLLQSRIELPKAIADASEDGPSFFQDAEALGVGLAAMRTVASQIYYGNPATPTDYGFQGLKAAVAAGSSLSTDATGTTAGTASSVYFVKFGTNFVQLIAGRNATLDLGPWREESVLDSANNPLDAYVAHLTSWMGLQLSNPNAVSRIYNLTADSGKGLTDAIIATHLAKLPVGYTPDVILMSRRSRAQLQNARTVVINAGPGASKAGTGIGPVADLPTQAFGIPIAVTDSILDTDTIGS